MRTRHVLIEGLALVHRDQCPRLILYEASWTERRLCPALQLWAVLIAVGSLVDQLDKIVNTRKCEVPDLVPMIERNIGERTS